MKYRRGFKAETNAYARELREELNLKPHEPMSPWALANHLEIPVLPLTELTEIPNAVKCLTTQEKDSFSAVTVFYGLRRSIVYNDAHHIHRQASNISHELSHGILGHKPLPSLNEYGCRYYNKELEDEANWLGPALLVSEEAALYIASRKISTSQAIKTYGVSEDIIRMRLNVVGAYKRVRRR